MKSLVTPKQVARSIQVSESSVKRWCDKGVIPTQYTAGGHRRIPISGLLDFLRSSKYELIRPETIGLPATVGQSKRVIDRAAEQFAEALLQGDEQQCRQITLDLFLAEHAVSAICDQVLARAFMEVGARWECGEVEIYQERRGCELALHVLREMRVLVSEPAPDAPLAIGGAPGGDQYDLATMMVELVLRDAKWNAVSLGNNLPFSTMAAAIKDQHPRLFWLSASHLHDETAFLEGYGDFFDEFGHDVAIVVGGRALTPEIRSKMKYAAYGDSLMHLESFAQTRVLQGT